MQEDTTEAAGERAAGVFTFKRRGVCSVVFWATVVRAESVSTCRLGRWTSPSHRSSKGTHPRLSSSWIIFAL